MHTFTKQIEMYIEHRASGGPADSDVEAALEQVFERGITHFINQARQRMDREQLIQELESFKEQQTTLRAECGQDSPTDPVVTLTTEFSRVSATQSERLAELRTDLRLIQTGAAAGSRLGTAEVVEEQIARTEQAYRSLAERYEHRIESAHRSVEHRLAIVNQRVESLSRRVQQPTPPSFSEQLSTRH